MNGMLLGDRFVLEREIGSGGMARVFLGRDSVLDRPVAIKVLNPGHDETDIGSRFRREGRTAARLSHPNIVQVFDAGEAELDGKKVSYIVMEYVPGGDLKDLIDKQGSLRDEDLARLGAGAAAGLAHAHERGVIHRDVKPHNVLIDAYGEPKLTDFGIARALDATTSQATKTGSYLGTALYSAPEQLQGQKVTPKSDVYSLGVTLYQAAAGNVPFLGTPMEVAGQHIHQPPVPPQKDGVGVGGELEALILDCLSKDPELRPTAGEVHDRLREEANRVYEQAIAPPPPVQEEEPRPTRQAPRPAPTAAPAPRRQRQGRGPLLLGLAAVLLVLLGIALYSALGIGEDPSTAPNPRPNDEQAQPAAVDEEQEPPAENPEAAAEPDAQGQEQQEPPQDSAREQQQQDPPRDDAQGGNAGEENGLTQEAAEQTVQRVYDTAVSADYDASYALLSQRFRQDTAPTQPAWSGQFESLQSLTFEEGPTAQVEGDTATVTGTTIATHTDRTERNSASWTLVNEGGEWKLDDITLLETELI